MDGLVLPFILIILLICFFFGLYIYLLCAKRAALKEEFSIFDKIKEFEQREREEKMELARLMPQVKRDPRLINIDWSRQKNDAIVIVKSRQALNDYEDIKFFRNDSNAKLDEAIQTIDKKEIDDEKIAEFMIDNEFKESPVYSDIIMQLIHLVIDCHTYNIEVRYVSSADKILDSKQILVTRNRINELKAVPELLMSNSELNKFIKEKEKEELLKKQKEYYDRVNEIIDYVKDNKEKLIIKGDSYKLDELVSNLFDRTINSISKIKTLDSEEWRLFENYITNIYNDIEKIIETNQNILDYYESEDFELIKSTCESLMSTQREFNEYINEKASSIAGLFGTRIIRNETIRDDKYNYIRPYSKTLTPFTAEVSSTVFASAENNPIEYIVKYFYPNRDLYPEQIQKLQLLIEELETLKDAKVIIENHKKDYEQYLRDVPLYVLDNDKSGFYSRLGFANIDESVLNIEYKFSYTSNGGMTQRSFTVPMTEDTISELITSLSSKLTTEAFTKEQRALMTKKLRDFIKKRDNYTCCNCGNSIDKEPNLLLEIDHIVPVSKGGYTEENNLQTLCWKCNRSKSNKII